MTWQYQVRILTIVQIATILAIPVVAYYVHRNDSKLTIDAAIQDVLDQGTRISTALVKELAVRETIAASVASSALLMPDLSEDQFAQLAEGIIRNEEDIINLAYAPDFVVRFVYPATPNSAVIGLDYREPSEFTAGANTAIEKNQPVLIGPTSLLQGGEALILRVPVSGTRKNEADEPGLVSLVMDIGKLLEQAGVVTAIGDLSIAGYGGKWDGLEERLVFGSASSCGPHAVKRSFPIVDTSWTFCMSPKAGWPVHGENTKWIVILTVLATLSTASVFIVINRLRAREASAKTQLWDAIEAINDGFALFDNDDRLVMFNAKYCEIYGKSRESIHPGQTFREIIEYGVRNGQYVDAIGDTEEWIEQRMAAHREVRGELEQELHDGRWIKVSERRTSDGGTVGFRVDITDLKRAQHEAEAANIATTEFLNNINHEIRTPLSVIVGFIKFLSHPEVLRSHKALKKTLDDKHSDRDTTRANVEAFVSEIKSYAERIQRSSAHLHALVQDTLDLSKVTRGDLPIDPEKVDLALLVNECMTQFSHEADMKGLDLQVDIPPTEIWADSSRLRQILLNLIGNAVKFTNNGYVKVRAELSEDTVLIQVSDTGPGIAEEHRERIFEKFWQVDGSAIRKHGGTGQGLAISDALVKLHGGKIWVEPAAEGGAVFCIRLPRLLGPLSKVQGSE